jgi:hypothetical protein
MTNINFDLYDALRHANVDGELARRASTRDLDDGAIRREFGTVKWMIGLVAGLVLASIALNVAVSSFVVRLLPAT